MLKIAVINDYLGMVRDAADWSSLKDIASVDFFRDPIRGEDALVAALSSYDVIVTERDRTPFPRSLIERLPKLRLLAASGPVNFVIDLEATRERNITVCYTDALMGATPELTWGLVLSLSRGIPWNDAAIRAGGWQKAAGFSLAGKTLGVLGLGITGSQIVGFAHAFKMKTLAWSTNLTDEKAASCGTKRAELDELLAASDLISIHLVLSDRTRGLLGREQLGKMKRDAYLINTSRGPIVKEEALIEALQKKTIAGAALDVFDVEPLPTDHPFRRMDNVVLSPHIGYITEDQLRLFYGQIVESILTFTKGAPVRVMTRPMMV